MNFFLIAVFVYSCVVMIWKLIRSAQRKEWANVKFQIILLVIASLIFIGLYSLNQ